MKKVGGIEMENLRRELQKVGHYASLFEGEVITNSMYTVRASDRGYIVTNDQDGTEMLFGTEAAVIDFLNINGNQDMMDFMKQGRQDKGFFLLQTHSVEGVSERRRTALLAANKHVRALEDLLASKRSTTKLTHCELCNQRLSKAERERFGTECEKCADSLKETFENIRKAEGETK